MIKSRTVQLVYQAAFCALAVVGVLENLGLFSADFNENFYVYYTSLSNYICTAFMFASLAATIRAAGTKEDGYCTFAPTLKFLVMLLILVTLLVYNLLLCEYDTLLEYFSNLGNALYHLVLPVMFVLDWVLFYERGQVKPVHILLGTVMPLVYVAFIFVRAAVLGSGYDGLLYPYFFLDLASLGWGGLVQWILILLAGFLVLGFGIYVLDNWKKLRKKN